MSSRSDARVRRWPALVAGVAALLLVTVAVPSARAGLKAPGVLAEALQLRWPRPLAPAVDRVRSEVAGVTGDRYVPSRGGRPILLVPGATPQGLDDTRAIRAATALARSGREVFVPVLDLYEEEFGRDDVDRIVAAATALAEASDDGLVTLVGFSYGGSFALLAAAEPPLRQRVAVIGTFGSYWDMAGVAQAAATGVSLVDGQTVPWPADPRAEGIFVEQVLGLAPSLREDLSAALAGETDVDELDPHAAALHDLLTHDDPARTADIVAALPVQARARLDVLSPSTVAERITAPVVVLHDVADPAVPYGEALRIARDLPAARVHTVELFEHVDLGADRPRIGLARDLLGVWRFVRAVLAPQEPSLGTLGPRQPASLAVAPSLEGR